MYLEAFCYMIIRMKKPEKPAAYDPAKIEAKWQKKWARSKLYASKETTFRKQDSRISNPESKFYVLDMFPYPSGEGLHVGHPKGYIATDVISRMKRMQGKSVLHPMGFDAFGLPAENYAIKTKTNPEAAVKKNVARYKEQLEMLGLDYDWSREVNTTDPNYYRWTQWIFLQLYKKGLAFESNEPVNWCPTDKTVLANEDVEDGRCERCGTPVEKKPLRQWVLRITDYADRLLKDLDATDYVRPVVVDKVNPHQPGKPLVKRSVAHAIVYDPKTGKYLIIRNKKFNWDTVVIGGVEEGEDPIEAARREVREETGYTDLEFKRVLGGETEAHYYTKHKDQNRVAYATGVYFELKSDARVAIGADEDKDNEILWIDENDFVPGKMVNSELPIWLARLSVETDFDRPVPLFTEIRGKSAFKEGAQNVERNALMVIVKHWKEDKYIGLKWKKGSWQTIITGGAEGDQTAVEGAIAEIREETGYQNPKFIRSVGSVDANFYHNIKNVNRIGHFEVLYFELKDGKRAEMAADEQALHEVVWLAKEDMGSFINSASQRYAWNALFLGKPNEFARADKPLLDWPNSIKELQRNWIGKSEGAEIDFRLTVKSNKTRFVILHGYKGSPDTNFIPWLKKTLEKYGHEVTAPALPNTTAPIEAEQVAKVLADCKLDENTVIIGHSLGSIVAMKALLKLNKPIGGLVLVSPAANPELSTKKRSYDSTFDWNIDVKRVNELAGGKIAVLIDVNDDKGRVAYGRILAKDLLARVVEVASKDRHFCATEEIEVLKSVTPFVTVFTTRPDTLFGVTYIVLAPEHPWMQVFLPHIENKAEVEAYISKAAQETEIQRTDASKEKTGVELKGIKAVNPANGEEVPVWIADYVLADYGTGAVMAVPAHDERDYAFAKKFNLPIREVVSGGDISKEAFTSNGKLINSASFNGKDSESVKKEIVKFANGRWVSKYKLRDWVFSRQRYWGEPIPLIHCPDCGVVPVPEKELPVKLPKVKSYEPTGTGESPLANIPSWVNVKCPQCKGKARRETNTMPQWAGSCWYYLRYMDPKNKKAFVDPKKEKYWAPVDLYVGGAEHATRHLIYARFWHKVLFDLGYVSTSEPFKKLQSVGLIMGEDGRKMSKRFGNVVNPDEVVKAFGADSLRVYEMFMGPFDQQIAWSTDSIVGTRRFIERVWKLRERIRDRDEGKGEAQIINKTIKKVTEDIENFRLNTAVSALMIAVNELERLESIGGDSYEKLLKLVAPFTPHVAEELWINLGNKKSIHVSEWPTYDPKLAADSETKIIVQVNGKVRGSFMAPTGAGKDELLRLAKELPEARKWLEGNEIKKEIVVLGRLVNLVV